MHIEELELEGKKGLEKSVVDDHSIDEKEEEFRVRVRVLRNDRRNDVVWDPKMVLIGAVARVLFYPTLLYNVVRNKLQAEFRWWDPVDQFVLLGAVPFPGDVLRLKELGVHGVVTLNEPYETLVPTSLYHAHDIDHLVLPTRDYLFAPSMNDICRAVDFIHRNASNGWMTYVHCKAGRGRSTTIVLCYLVQHKKMTPEDAYSYVRSIRPRVLLAFPQWQAVKDYYNLMVKKNSGISPTHDSARSRTLLEFDDRSVVVVSTTDLDGYEPCDPSVNRDHFFTDPSVVYKVRVAGQAALTRLSCMWLRCHTQNKIVEEQLCSKALQITGNDIHVY